MVDASLTYAGEGDKITVRAWGKHFGDVFRPASIFALATGRLIGAISLPPHTFGDGRLEVLERLLMDNSSRHNPGYDAADLADIPGTTIFTTASSRRAYQLHRFCMSLMKAENRQAFKADESEYIDRFPMTPDQRQGVIDRDFNRLIALGGNIYFLVKISNTDGWSVQRAVGTMAGMSADEYAAMMIAGGRSPVGNRSIKGAH